MALANKNARTAWALLTREQDYHVVQPTAEAPAALAGTAREEIPGGTEVADSCEGKEQLMARQVGPACHEPEPALGLFEAVWEMRRGVRGFHRGPGTEGPSPEAEYKCATVVFRFGIPVNVPDRELHASRRKEQRVSWLYRDGFAGVRFPEV